MKNYIFRTYATMKPYNRGKWWIDRDIIGEIAIKAQNLTQAIEKYLENVEQKHYITISKSAAKNAAPMYVGREDGAAEQIGLVFTAQADFRGDERNRWSRQFIELWVEILTVETPDFAAA